MSKPTEAENSAQSTHDALLQELNELGPAMTAAVEAGDSLKLIKLRIRADELPVQINTARLVYLRAHRAAQLEQQQLVAAQREDLAPAIEAGQAELRRVQEQLNELYRQQHWQREQKRNTEFDLRATDYEIRSLERLLAMPSPVVRSRNQARPAAAA